MKLTTRLNNGIEVLAKVYRGELCAKTYANRSQAEKAADAAGYNWAVYHRGRPFYVAHRTTKTEQTERKRP